MEPVQPRQDKIKSYVAVWAGAAALAADSIALADDMQADKCLPAPENGILSSALRKEPIELLGRG